MAIPLHAFLVGLPFRLRYVRAALGHIRGHDEVWFTTADEIADWAVENLVGEGAAAETATG
jgi:allantoinase